MIIIQNARITPKKIGQFVSIWKRNEAGKTQPYTEDDDFDSMIINCKRGENSGVFTFPKSVLINQNIISTKIKTGKMGMRVYPSWDTATNKQAMSTQKWQLEYFIKIS